MPTPNTSNPSVSTGELRSAFGKRLKDLRLARGLSQAELAAQLHLSSVAITRYEQGLREPSFETLKAIAEFFGVDFNFLLCYSMTQLPQNGSDLISKFNLLDGRGKSAVLNVLEFEYLVASTK